MRASGRAPAGKDPRPPSRNAVRGRPAGSGLLGPTPPASKPNTHSSPSPRLLRPRRAGCRRAGDASCRADGPGSRLPVNGSADRSLLLTHPSLPLSFRPQALCLSSLFSLSLSLWFLVLRSSLSILSFPPSLLSPPPFPSLCLLARAGFPDPAQARASALLRKGGGREPLGTGKTPSNPRLPGTRATGVRTGNLGPEAS
uniref:Uncharacterized protein n=1 Tax=Gorilla gorilla gorilla TaxID=9595 RepID=A0A2I2YFH4_GORGO